MNERLPRRLGVIGIGRIGLCYALLLERAGFEVIGCDVDRAKVRAVAGREFETQEPGVTEVLRGARNLEATTDLSMAVAQAEVLFVFVRTSSDADGRYDVSQVDAVVESLAALEPSAQRKDLVICANVNVGYSDEVATRLEPYNFRVSYVPELIALGTILRNQTRPDLVLLGQADAAAGDRILEVLRRVIENDPPIHRLTRAATELAKISLNCFLTLKIASANQVGDVARRLGVDPDAVLGAVGTDPRIGSAFLGYGFGYGGPCLPRDNRAFAHLATTVGCEALLNGAADEANRRHLEFLVEEEMKNRSDAEPLVIESVTYKPGTTSLEESQQLAYAVALAERGVPVVIRESEAVIEKLRGLYGDLFAYEARPFRPIAS